MLGSDPLPRAPNPPNQNLIFLPAGKYSRLLQAPARPQPQRASEQSRKKPSQAHENPPTREKLGKTCLRAKRENQPDSPPPPKPEKSPRAERQRQKPPLRASYVGPKPQPL